LGQAWSSRAEIRVVFNANFCETHMTILPVMRAIRDSSASFKLIHSALRGPYYTILDTLHRRGIRVVLSGNVQVRLAPRLNGIRPEKYEPVLSAILDQHLRAGMMVLDVGAHVGLHTLRFMSRVGHAGRVIAVEPSPANARLLRQHLDWNDCHNVTVFEAAVGETEGEIEFAFRPDPVDPGGFANSIAYDIGGQTTKVRMTTIDAICTGIPPDLIKIDVEGAELLAVRGAQATLSRASPVLIVAFHPDAMGSLGTSPAELVRLLDILGYSGHHLDGRAATVPAFEEIIFEKRR
jgi:FkbM family methyltransferase